MEFSILKDDIPQEKIRESFLKLVESVNEQEIQRAEFEKSTGS